MIFLVVLCNLIIKINDWIEGHEVWEKNNRVGVFVRRPTIDNIILHKDETRDV